jgi:hypothetical protein
MRKGGFCARKRENEFDFYRSSMADIIQIAKSASVESSLITVRKIGNGSSIALHQLAARTN